MAELNVPALWTYYQTNDWTQTTSYYEITVSFWTKKLCLCIKSKTFQGLSIL